MSLLVKTDSSTGRQLHKFGGSSLADVKCYQRVARIMAKYSRPGDLMVVSAAGSTTNQLLSWLTLRQNNQLSANQVQESLYFYQKELISGLLSPENAEGLLIALIRDLKRLAVLLDGTITEAVYAEIIGHGEIWSARLMAALLGQMDMEAQWLDSRDFLCAERTAQPQIDESRSWPLLQQLLIQNPSRRLVFTGFICRNQAGETVLLGRNGSDYSATQIGALASVTCVTIWGDVAGVYSADPNKVKNACLLPLLRLDEASELARLAAPILHSRTLQPLFSNSDIDLLLRCSYQPEQGSTHIERILSSGTETKIITSHDDVCLIELTIQPQCNFALIHKEIEIVLKCAQIEPLAVGIHRNRRLLQLCYTSEIAENALYLLKQTDLPAYLKLRKSMALVALVGAGVAKNPLYSHCFYRQLKHQPIEFFWQAENGISLVAVLRAGPTKHVIQKLHTSLFPNSIKSVDLMLLGNRGIGLRWMKLFPYKQKNLASYTSFKFIFAGAVENQHNILIYDNFNVSRVLTFFKNEKTFTELEDLFLRIRIYYYSDIVVQWYWI